MDICQGESVQHVKVNCYKLLRLSCARVWLKKEGQRHHRLRTYSPERRHRLRARSRTPELSCGSLGNISTVTMNKSWNIIKPCTENVVFISLSSPPFQTGERMCADIYCFNGRGSSATPLVYLITLASDLPRAATAADWSSGLRAFLVVSAAICKYLLKLVKSVC